METLTLAFLVKDDAICLALKKRGFGAGKWNGFGGKLQSGETVRAAAVREIGEECEVVVAEADLEPIMDVEFIYPDRHVCAPAFLVRQWEGDPVETEEMRPAWFAFADIPYDQMWEDDQHWLPRVLEGERLTGRVWFDASGEKIERMEWQTVQQFTEGNPR